MQTRQAGYGNLHLDRLEESLARSQAKADKLEQPKSRNFNSLADWPFLAGLFSHLFSALGHGEQRREKAQMATLEEIGQEKQRIAERLARLDTERTKLAEQLNELEVAERVLSRFGEAGVTGVERRRRGRPARTAVPAAGERRARSTQTAQGPSLSDAALKAVEAHGNGATAGEISSYLARELGKMVRPNHLGIALQRHRRAGRLENRDQRWFLPQAGGQESSQSDSNRMTADGG